MWNSSWNVMGVENEFDIFGKYLYLFLCKEWDQHRDNCVAAASSQFAQLGSDSETKLTSLARYTSRVYTLLQ